jgi:hypothetical protein
MAEKRGDPLSTSCIGVTFKEVIRLPNPVDQQDRRG